MKRYDTIIPLIQSQSFSTLVVLRESGQKKYLTPTSQIYIFLNQLLLFMAVLKNCSKQTLK